MQEEIQISIPVETIKHGLVSSFVKEFLQSMGATFDASALGTSITYDAVVDSHRRELRIVLVFDASLLRPKEIPKYISKIEFGGKLTTSVSLDLNAMFNEVGRLVYMDDDKIVVSVPLEKLNEVPKHMTQVPVAPVQKSKASVTIR